MATQKLKNNEYNMNADNPHKNDNKGNTEAYSRCCHLNLRVKHKDDSQVCESDCTTPLSFLRKRKSSVHNHFMTQAFRISQSGRSMVEMLGVLSIIGVLSIGGIMGYSYGMDRWRANTTLNDVHLRMVDVMTQVFRGQTDIALSEEWPLTGQAGYVIDLFQNIDSEPSIMVEGVPSSVCKIILKNTPDTQDVFVGTKNGEGIDGAWYTRDNDGICEDGNKEILFALNEDVLGNMDEAGARCQADSDCSADKPFCDNGICKECTEDSHCPNENPRCDIEKGVCHECISNDDCGTGQFCADTNESSSKATPYTCQNLSFSSINLTNEEGITETWHYSNEPMSWWDTKMACEAMDLRMPKWEEIASGFQGDWTGYSIIRPHVKTLYKLLTKSSAMTDRPLFPISDWRYFVLSDGFMPNLGAVPKNTNDHPGHIVFGVCKQ